MKACRPILAVLLAAIPLSTMTGCSRYRAQTSVALPVRLPPAFSEPGTAAAPDRWWQAFADPTLNALVERVLADNLDVKAAMERVNQALAVGRTADAARRPSGSASGGVTRYRQVFLMSQALGGGTPSAFYRSQYDLSAAASYELDLWHRLGDTVRAAGLDAAAAEADLETTRMTLAATVTDTWLDLIQRGAELELLDEQYRVGETLLGLIELRLGQGISSALDVLQQRQQLAAIRASVPPLRASVETLRHRLALLMGQPPDASLATPPTSLPTLPPPPTTGVPVELLARRPDVRAAQLRILAADRRVAAAVADRLPQLKLNAGTGFSAASAGDLLHTWIWNLGAGLVAPLFDGGRRRAEVERNRAIVEERLQLFGKSLLTALVEVEDALAQERWQRELVQILGDNVELARTTLDEAKVRYRNGLSDYLPVLAALQALQGLERTELAARRSLLAHRVALHRALGGSWMAEPAGKDL